MDQSTDATENAQAQARHRAGLMTHVRELRAEVAAIRHDLAALVEAVRQSEPQQDHHYGRR
jgi:hypothetical protein